MDTKGFFEDLKYCLHCQRPLALTYEEDLCPTCQENELFSQVKEYIRSKDVTEYMVAEKFEIPLRKVRTWIKEGRIEYKELDNQTLAVMKCIECGEPVQFGSYCKKCYKLKMAPKGSAKISKEESKMRFLE